MKRAAWGSARMPSRAVRGILNSGLRNGCQPAAADRAAESREGDGLAQTVVAPQGVEHRCQVVVDHVVQAVSGAQNGLVGNLPGQTHVGSEVVPVVVEERPSVGRAGEIDDGVGVQHRFDAAYGQQGQAVRLVRDGVELPPDSESEAEFRSGAPRVRQVKVDEVLGEKTRLRGPVDESRSRRGDVERLFRLVNETSQSAQQPGSGAQLAGGNAAGKDIGNQRVRVPRAETEEVGVPYPRH